MKPNLKDRGGVITGNCCGMCPRAFSNGKQINVIDKKGRMKNMVVCEYCRQSREFMFVDDDGLVWYNKIKKESRSTLL